MKQTYLHVLLFSGVIFSCSNPSEVAIREIWLPNGLQWQPSKTGLPEIDTIRKESYTEVLVLFEDKLFYGSIDLYQQIKSDSITIAFEAGEMVFSGKDCLQVKEITDGKSINTSEGSLSFTKQGNLLYKQKQFKRVELFSNASKKELLDKLRKFCR